MKYRKYLPQAAGFIIFLLLVMLAAAYFKPFQSTPAVDIEPLAAPLPGGVIRVGVLRDFPPQYVTDGLTGKPTGFAVEIFQAVAERSELEVEFVAFDSWANLNQALKDKEIDAIANTGITDERREFANFTAPVETFPVHIFVRSTTHDILTAEDLSGRSVAVVATNVGVSLMQERQDVSVVLHDSPEQALLDMLSGHSDALIYPAPVMNLIAIEAGLEDKVKVVGDPLLEIKRSIAVRKDDAELVQQLDDTVHDFIDSPEYKEIYSHWYGNPAPFWNTRRVILGMGGILVLTTIILAGWRYSSVVHLNEERRLLIIELEEKNLEQANSERRFRGTFEQAAVGIAHVALDGRFLRANQKLCDILGYPLEELLELTFQELTFPDDLQEDLDYLQQVLDHVRDTYQMEKRYFHKDGRVIWAGLTTKLISDHTGKPEYFVAVIEEISERKHAEELLKATLKEKDVLLREIHHRVKNNLQIVSSLLDMQSGQIFDPRDKDIFENSEARVHSMALVHELLYQSNDLGHIDFARYLHELSSYLRTIYISNPNILLEIEAQNILLSVDQAIPCGLLLNELVSNALKYAYPGGQSGVVCIILTHGEDAEGEEKNYCCLQVSDQGTGIPPELDFDEPKTFGVKLIHLLANQLNGKVELDRSSGTTWKIKFSIV